MTCNRCSREVAPLDLACRGCLIDAERSRSRAAILAGSIDVDLYKFSGSTHVYEAARGSFKSTPGIKRESLCGIKPRAIDTIDFSVRAKLNPALAGICNRCIDGLSKAR